MTNILALDIVAGDIIVTPDESLMMVHQSVHTEEYVKFWDAFGNSLEAERDDLIEIVQYTLDIPVEPVVDSTSNDEPEKDSANGS